MVERADRSGFRVVLVSMYDQGTHGHRSLSAVLKAEGFDVYNVFFGDTLIQDVPSVSPRELDALEHVLRGIDPHLVGLSVTSLLCQPAAAAVCGRIRQTLDVPLVFGGPYPTLLPEWCVRNNPIDYVCVGEGEEALSQLCHELAEGRSADEVPGIFSRRSGRALPRDPPADLDALPFPDVDVDARKFLIRSGDGSVVAGDPFLGAGSYNTKCSRNCPFNCSYCAAPNVRRLAAPGAHPLRRRSVARVIAEIAHAREVHPTVAVVGFWDDTFPSDPRWVEEFAAAYRDKIRLPFHIWVHPKTVRAGNIAALAAAGLKGAIMGIESACETTRKRVFLRPESNAEVVAADEVLARHGIERGYDLILDHPWESPDELPETFDLVSRLTSPFHVNLHSLVLFPETQLAQRTIEEGLARDQQEIIDGILVDIDETRNKCQWVRRVPRQRDLARAYWVFLILSLGNRGIPTRLVTWLARRKLLRRHPELLTDLDVIDMRSRNDEFGAYVTAVFRQSRISRPWLRLAPWLDRALAAGFRRSASFALLSYLAHRLPTRGLRLLLRRLRGGGTSAAPPAVA